MEQVTFHLRQTKEISYPIRIGADILGEVAMLIQKNGFFESVFLLHDAAVETIARTIQAHIPNAHLISVPSGEESKSFHQLERILRILSTLGANRQSILINVGGGMITDLGGCAASMYMRGVTHMHVPTTLLGMVDAAIGGKTGIDLSEGKNLAGSFHHPFAVLIDVHVLQSLPDMQLREGLVEVVKIAAMMDPKFFRYLEGKMRNLLSRASVELSHCIAQAVRLKVGLVERDEHDTEKRLYLNFGHTVGHAIETLSNFSISHGQAVSIGMIAEMEASESSVTDRVRALLHAMDMPLVIPPSLSREALFKQMRRDKKVIKGTVRIAVPAALGKPTLVPLSEEHFLQAHV